MEICDINHLHRRFLDIWEWCMRQGFDTRAFTYVENAFKSEPTAELADRKTEPQKDCKKCKNYEKCKNNKWKCCVYQPIEDEPQTEEPSFTATDFGKGTITRYTDEPQTDCPWK